MYMVCVTFCFIPNLFLFSSLAITARIADFGSLNCFLILCVPRMAHADETLMADTMDTFTRSKCGNGAVAATWASGDVCQWKGR